MRSLHQRHRSFNIRTFATLALLGGGTVARADVFNFQPLCDSVWQACCGGGNTKFNNWGRSSPAPVCPVQPTGIDDVFIDGDCTVGPSPAESAAAGTLVQSAGTFTVNGNLGIGTSATFAGPVIWNAAEIGRSGAAGAQFMRCDGGLQIAGDTDKVLSFLGGFRLSNTASAEWSGNGSWTIGMIPGGCCPSIFRNEAGATFTVRNDASIFSNAFGPGRIDNAGLLVKDTATGTSNWSVNLNNTGTVHLKTGALRLTQAGTIGGNWLIDPGAELQIAGNFFSLDPAVVLTGRAVVLDSGSGVGVTVAQPVTIDDLTVAATGNVGGNGLLSFRGTLTVEGGIPSAPIRILPDAVLNSAGSQRFGPLNIAGTANLNAGATGSFGGVLTVEQGGVVNLADGATLGNSSLSVQPIQNYGTIRKAATNGSATIASAFNWTLVNNPGGVMDVAAGTLDCFNRLEQSGEIRIASGATFHQATWANYHAGATFTGDGTVLIDNQNNFIDAGVELSIPRLAFRGGIGTAAFNGPGAVRITRSLELGGGGYNVDTTIAAGATMSVAGPGFTESLNWQNLGQATITSGGLNYFTTFNNRAGALVDVQGDIYFGGRFGNGVFNNDGTYIKSAGTGDSGMNGTLNNSGLVSLRAGRLSVNSFNQTAGTTEFAGGGLYTGTAVLNGGIITGVGIVNASVSNAAGALAPGNGIGTLQLAADSGVAGDYSQGAAGSLRIQIGGTTPGSGHDQFVIARNAALNGGLNIQLVGGYQPSIGDAFTILNCGGSRSGTFARVSGVNIGNGKRFNVQYGAQNVTLTVVTGGSTPGDIDGDGHVTLIDLANLLTGFGLSDGQTGFSPAADVNGDGAVGLIDLATLLTNFGL